MSSKLNKLLAEVMVSREERGGEKEKVKLINKTLVELKKIVFNVTDTYKR